MVNFVLYEFHFDKREREKKESYTGAEEASGKAE